MRWAATWLALAGLGTLAAQTTTPTPPIEQVTLSNGLRVILLEDRAAPTYSINVTYDVGSRNEVAGHTGLAHLFEHMMFEGTPAVPKGELAQLVFAHGGNSNGTTNKDRTAYYETLLSNQLDLGLFLEADRMRSLPLALTQEKLDNQRLAVEEERRQAVDNAAYGATPDALDQLAYDNFGYRHPIIGSMDDLNHASLADVTAFFTTYYAPNNAVLALVGNFNRATALSAVKRYFGDIPHQPPPPAPDMSQPPQTAERRATLTDAFATLPRLDIAFRGPAGNTPDWYALDLLSVVLTGSRAARLYQALTQQRPLAVNVQSSIEDDRGPALFKLTAIPRPGHTLTELEQAVEAALAQVAVAGVTKEELERALAQRSVSILHQDQTTLGRANALANYAVLFHQPELAFTRVDRYRAVTAEQIQAAAARYLTPSQRSVLLTLPKPAEAQGTAR